ncbi:DUF742 domain-containing protein [Nocardioides sp.]|uniref:DUF742 domain-containing protein n=1 Tax=Nocardioides sp. TaxID=35761 RepID=UPI0035620BE6
MTPLPTTPWPEDGSDAPQARVVRHFTLTSGRAKSVVDIPLEATIRRLAIVDGPEAPPPAGVHARILQECDTLSLADLSSSMEMAVGVLRVLVGDLVEQGHVRVQATLTSDSSVDERRDLIERTLRGLRSL